MMLLIREVAAWACVSSWQIYLFYSDYKVLSWTSMLSMTTAIWYRDAVGTVEPFVFWILGNMVIGSWNRWQWKKYPGSISSWHGNRVPGLQFSCRWLEMVCYLLSKRPFLYASMDITERIIALPRRLLFDRDYFWYLASLLLIGELVFNGLIINKVACKWIIYHTLHVVLSLSYVYRHCRHWNRLGGLYARGEGVLGWWARLHAVARRYWTSRVSTARVGKHGR